MIDKALSFSLSFGLGLGLAADQLLKVKHCNSWCTWKTLTVVKTVDKNSTEIFVFLSFVHNQSNYGF